MTTTRLAPQTESRLVAADGRTLPLHAVQMSCEAGGGLARTHLVQRFRNPYAEPLALTYQLPLPADGAVAAFSFRIGDRRVVGEIDRREAARDRFEQALIEGHTAALVEQDRDDLFCQEIGNVPPGVDVVAELTVDQPLAWREGGRWEWRFPTVVAPRYLGEPGRVPDAGRVAVDVADRALPPRLEVELTIRDALAAGGVPTSPSHTLAVRDRDVGVDIRFDGAARLDRDVVVRWGVGTGAVGGGLRTARPAASHPLTEAAYGLLTLVPPANVPDAERLGRDLIVLLDTSGSMHGEPLDQAKAIASALVQTLTARDRLEMIEFGSEPRPWSRRAVAMDERGRRDALRWIAGLRAGGGTEMQRAIVDALRPLDAESQRQVVLVTDGQIGFEQEILAEILHRLPRGARVHTLGVGSAPNRSLTRAAARAGRGVETLVGLGEDPDDAAARLRAATSAPVVVDVELDGSALLAAAPRSTPDLFAGAPVRVAVRLRPEGGRVVARGRTVHGAWQQAFEVPATAAGVGRAELVTLFGREQVADLEMLAATGEAGIGARIEAAGLAFGIATRRTSWIAVSEERDVDPRAPLRRERIAQELPYGMSVEGLGLRPTQIAPDFAFGRSVPSVLRAKRRASEIRPDMEMLQEAPPPAAHAPRPTAAHGRLVQRSGGFLVFELDLGGADWTPPSRVSVVFDDGSEHAADVDAGHTTGAGWIAAGAVVRLRLEEPESMSARRPQSIRFELHGTTVLVDLT
jgi:Ca-activated chloride channel family protein